MAGSDIFNVQVPQWLTEITTMDTTRPGREAFALGLAARKQQDESKLLGLRVQAQMLASQARIQQLENANEAAAMRLLMQQGQLKLAGERLQAIQDAAVRKVSDVQTYHKMWNTLDAPTRQKLDEMNPDWLTKGPTLDQWNSLNSEVASRQQSEADRAASLGLTPKTMKVGDVTYSAANPTEKPEFFTTPSGREFMRWGSKHYDLNEMPQATRFKVQQVEKDLTSAAKAFDAAAPDDPNYSNLQARFFEAQSAFDSLLKPYTPKTVTGQPIVAPQTSSGNIPQPGEVRSGYRFTGGAPGDPNSWEPASESALPGE